MAFIHPSEGDQRDYADYDELEAKRKRRLAYEAAEAAAVTTTATTNAEPLTLESLERTVQHFTGPFPEPVTLLEINGQRYPVKDFSLDLGPKEIGIDMASGPDVTMLNIWQRNQLMDSIEIKPYLCNWARVFEPVDAKLIPFTRLELRQMRKRIRDKAGKQLLKRLARNPLLAEQDPRKLRRLARHASKAY